MLLELVDSSVESVVDWGPIVGDGVVDTVVDTVEGSEDLDTHSVEVLVVTSGLVGIVVKGYGWHGNSVVVFDGALTFVVNVTGIKSVLK